MTDVDPFAFGAPDVTAVPEPAAPAAAAEPATESTSGRRRTGLASGGTSYQMPDRGDGAPVLHFPAPPTDEAFEPEDVDFEDLLSVNRAINQARGRLFRVNRELAIAAEAASAAELAYSSQFNRELVGMSGGSAETRKAAAEVNCEDRYSEMVVARRFEERLKRLSQTVRADLDALQNISHNVRAQLDVLAH
jgi:hypothetical protein